MSFLVALHTISMGFLFALITNSMNLFVALEHDFQREFCDLWTFNKPIFYNQWVYMNILTKCKLVVKEKKSWDSTFKGGKLHFYEILKPPSARLPISYVREVIH